MSREYQPHVLTWKSMSVFFGLIQRCREWVVEVLGSTLGKPGSIYQLNGLGRERLAAVSITFEQNDL